MGKIFSSPLAKTSQIGISASRSRDRFIIDEIYILSMHMPEDILDQLIIILVLHIYRYRELWRNTQRYNEKGTHILKSAKYTMRHISTYVLFQKSFSSIGSRLCRHAWWPRCFNHLLIISLVIWFDYLFALVSTFKLPLHPAIAIAISCRCRYRRQYVAIAIAIRYAAIVLVAYRLAIAIAIAVMILLLLIDILYYLSSLIRCFTLIHSYYQHFIVPFIHILIAAAFDSFLLIITTHRAM